ncbi:MAG: PAS domain-containing protein [Myxococcota bacterium]
MSEALRADADFRALVHAMPAGVLVHRAGVVLYANPAMAQLTGRREGSELVGLHVLHDIVHGDDRPLLKRRLATIGEAKQLPPAQVRLLRADGEPPRFAEGTAVMIPFEGGRAVGVVLRDRTEREEALKRASLAERLASVGTLAAGGA